MPWATTSRSTPTKHAQQVLMSWHGLRQQHERPAGKPNWCLADFIRPKDSGVPDYVGAFAVTAGLGIEGRLAEFERPTTTTTRSCSRAWPTASPRPAAEWLHARVRKEFWGYTADER
jgi:5-methyltetrahydrofolate--homocysteine methyltransferase